MTWQIVTSTCVLSTEGRRANYITSRAMCRNITYNSVYLLSTNRSGRENNLKIIKKNEIFRDKLRCLN